MSKKIIFLVNVLVFFSFTNVGFAFTGGPSGFTAIPTDAGIKVEWVNINNSGQYTQQTLSRTDSGSNYILQNKSGSAIGSGPQTYIDTTGPTVTSAANGGSIATYSYQLSTTQGGNSQIDTAQVRYADSQIITVTTKAATPPPVPSNTYTLSCAPLANAVYVSWMTNVVNPAAGTLYIGPNSIDFSQYSATVINNSGSITINASDLEGSNNYFVIKDANRNDLSKTVGPCGPLSSVSSDAPSQLSAFTNGSDSIYLNWKDNSTSTTPSHFEIQRFQVTPAAPSSFQVSETNDQSAINLTWINNTPPPYASYIYTEITRSTSKDFSNSSLFTATTSTLTDSNNLNGGTYYYRIRNCSSIPVSNFYVTASQVPNGSLNPKPSVACSDYTTSSITFTPPSTGPANAPTLVAVSSSTVDIFWQAVSDATYYWVARRLDNVGDWTSVNTYVTSTSYTDSNLTASTTYYYRIGSCNWNPCNTQWSPSASVTTQPAVTQSSQQQTTAITTVTIDRPTMYGFPICAGSAYQYCIANGYASGTDGAPYTGGTCIQYKNGSWNVTSGAEVSAICTKAATFRNSGGSVVLASDRQSFQLADLFQGFTNIVNWFGNHLARVIGGLSIVRTAEGQTLSNYDSLFQAGVDIKNVSTPSYFDTGLLPNTIYMYRVRLVYPNGNTSAWSNQVAGITLPAGGSCTGGKCMGNQSQSPICTAYGFCDSSVSSYSAGVFSSERQCKVNADCRNVGRASQQTQEQ